MCTTGSRAASSTKLDVVRLATNGRVFSRAPRRSVRAHAFPTRPDTTEAVLEYIGVLLDPPAQLVRAGTTHWSRFADLCRHLQLRGNLVPDAYLVAVALEQGAELVTFDRGFGRYSGLRWRSLLDR
jgi:predicted nucleic acid-binding protein